MKNLNNLLLLFICTLGYTIVSSAQSTTDPDSVCAGATGKIYQVDKTAGSTYQWIIAGGTKASGANSDSITINWSAMAGTDTLKVIEFNAIGCPGDTIKLAVVRLPLPTVSLSGTDSICLNSSTTAYKLTMAFTGVGPWNVAYTEDGSNQNVTTSTNPYTFNSKVYNAAGDKLYSINTVTGRLGCVGSKSGSAAVTVFSKPSTSSIKHY
jgi:hypothetical protein